MWTSEDLPEKRENFKDNNNNVEGAVTLLRSIESKIELCPSENEYTPFTKRCEIHCFLENLIKPL